MEVIPNEIIALIFKKLNVKSQLKFILTCKEFYSFKDYIRIKKIKVVCACDVNHIYFNLLTHIKIIDVLPKYPCYLKKITIDSDDKEKFNQISNKVPKGMKIYQERSFISPFVRSLTFGASFGQYIPHESLSNLNFCALNQYQPNWLVLERMNSNS
jgi:hypothetical protein